jgi:general secretion pathway protein N
MKRATAFSLLTGGALLAAVAAFNEMTPAAQAGLFDDTWRVGEAVQSWLRSAGGMMTAHEPSGHPPLEQPLAPREQTADRAAVTGTADPPSGNPLQALSVKQLSITRERPIFSPSRRPPPPPAPTQVASVAIQKPAKPPEPDHPMVSLVGTVIGPGDRIAVLIETPTNNVFRLRVGEDHQGWVLRLVNAREATMMNKSEQAVVLELPKPAEAAGTGNMTVLPANMPVISHEVSADEQPVRRRNAR